ncbi:hypothetical protein [Streptomyces sp. NPDC059786]|uniref:DUF7144 family membrane protein n=1 Tax=Streptomyces sp. NPDC059786 TaxID=3346946 RepID=UPI00365EF911
MTEQTSAGSAGQPPHRPRQDPYGAQAPPPQPPEARVRPLAIGGVVFAVCIMAIIGSYHIITGLAAIIDHNFYRTQDDYAYDFSINIWGWIQLVSGIIVLAAAFSVFRGRTWARVVGIVVATLSALETFFFTPYYPVWSVLIIGLDVLVIWSLATYGHREAHRVYGTPL